MASPACEAERSEIGGTWDLDGSEIEPFQVPQIFQKNPEISQDRTINSRCKGHSDAIVETSAAGGYEVRNGRARTNRDLVMILVHVTVSYEISENMFNLRSFRTVQFGHSSVLCGYCVLTAWKSLQVILQ